MSHKIPANLRRQVEDGRRPTWLGHWVNQFFCWWARAAISHGGTQRVRLVLVPPEKRAPILSEYVRVASSGRKHFPLSLGASLAEFAAIASQYPVYRIEPPALGPVRRYALRWLIGDLDARGIIRLLPDDVTRQGYLERAYTLGREF